MVWVQHGRVLWKVDLFVVVVFPLFRDCATVAWWSIARSKICVASAKPLQHLFDLKNMCTVYIIFVALKRLILAAGGKKILEPPLPLRDNFWFSVIQPSIFCSPYSHMVYGCAGADPSCLWVRGGVHPELVASHFTIALHL